MLSNAKKAWHVALAVILACALSLPSLAFGLNGNGDTSAAADGTMSVYVKDNAGNTKLAKSYTADEFAALAKQVDAGYQYGKNGTVTVLAVKKMVEFDDLIADAGLSQYWTDGASLTFDCTDGVYTKMQPSYEQLQQTGYFYPNRSNDNSTDVTEPIEVPAGIAIPGWYKSVQAQGSLSSDVLTTALNSLDGTITADNKAGDSTKVGIGIAEDVLNKGSYIDAGWRLTGSVISVTVNAPQGVTFDKLISEGTTISGAETQYYTGSAITPIKVADKDGNALTEGVDYAITYTNNVEPGTATFTITGMGAYAGSVTGSFVITDKILNVQINGLTVKSYTAKELSSLLKTDVQYYQQIRGGAINVYAVSDYISIADLFADANIDPYWKEGSSLQYICTDGLYGKDQPTFETLAQRAYTYPNLSTSDPKNTEEATEVPAVLAYKYGSASAGEGLTSDAYIAAEGKMKSNTTARAFCGWAPDENGNIEAPGYRMPSGVVTLNLKYAPASTTFTDVEAGSWYEDAVTFCNLSRYMTGYAGTTEFGVSNSLTRAEFATILFRIAEPGEASEDFTNVKNETPLEGVEDGMFYTAAANWAYSKGIITGVDGIYFEPYTAVDRQTMCTILYRFVNADAPSHEVLGMMPDGADVEPWALDGVAWALTNGVISGVDVDGTRYVQAYTDASRAMTAQIITNACYNGLL